MRFRVGLVVMLVCLVFQTGVADAATQEEIKEAIQTRYRVTIPGFFGDFKEIGSVLTVRRDGLKASRPSKVFKPNIIANREITAVGGGNLPLGGDLDGFPRTGDRLHLYGFRTGSDYLELDLFTVKTFVVSGVKGPTPLQATARFRYEGGLSSVTTQQVLEDVDSWLRADNPVKQELWSGSGTEPRPRVAPGTTLLISLGQTTAEVIAILGEPEKKVMLGPKSVFVYRDLKVVFMDGKVADAY